MMLSVLFVITLALWIFLPFAVYGIKSILREQSTHLAEIRQLVKKALLEVESSTSSETEKPTKKPDA